MVEPSAQMALTSVTPSSSTGSWVPTLLAASFGAVAVLLGQGITQWFEGRRHLKELRIRERERLQRYLEPLYGRRINALESVYDLIQTFIEEGSISEEQYLRVRRHFVQIPAELESQVSAALSEAVRVSSTPGGGGDIQRTRSQLKLIQRSIREILCPAALDDLATQKEFEQ